MRYYIIAGEASGDLHGSNLMSALRQADAIAQFRIWGGDRMQSVGGELVKHYRDLAFMGFVEVVANLRTILRNLRYCKQDILEWQPDVLILIDYPGFNMRIAKWAQKNELPVVYYISPQIWAWHQSRVKKIKRDVDLMLVILPFEEAFYKKHGVSVAYVGHPLLDAIPQHSQQLISEEKSNKPIIALLPGSRKQEISRVLPQMLSVVPHFRNYQFIIAAAPAADAFLYEYILEQHDLHEQVLVQSGKTYEILRQSRAALVTSGTATLETALFDVPQVVCYQGGRISYLIARQLIRTRFISLVNLIADKPVVTELIQDELNEKNLVQALSDLLTPQRQQQMKSDYAEIKYRLGGTGASQRAAQEILAFMAIQPTSS